MDEVKTDIAK